MNSAKAVSVSFSDLLKFERMDAGFYIAVASLKDRAREFKGKFGDRATATAQLSALPDSVLSGVLVLARGQVTNKGESIKRVITEYPYLSLAIVDKGMAETVQLIREGITQREDLLNTLHELLD